MTAPIGFVVVDPAARIARREGVALTQDQAYLLRRRVAEIESSLQRWAAFWGLTVCQVARIRLEIERAERRAGEQHKQHATQVHVIARRENDSAEPAGKWGPS